MTPLYGHRKQYLQWPIDHSSPVLKMLQDSLVDMSRLRYILVFGFQLWLTHCSFCHLKKCDSPGQSEFWTSKIKTSTKHYSLNLNDRLRYNLWCHYSSIQMTSFSGKSAVASCHDMCSHLTVVRVSLLSKPSQHNMCSKNTIKFSQLDKHFMYVPLTRYMGEFCILKNEYVHI